MRSQWGMVFGVAWPLVLPAMAAMACRIVEPEWHQFGWIVIAVSCLGLLAAPALGVAMYRQLPIAWPTAVRVTMVAVLTVPCAVAQAYAGLVVFTVIRPGWIY